MTRANNSIGLSARLSFAFALLVSLILGLAELAGLLPSPAKSTLAERQLYSEWLGAECRAAIQRSSPDMVQAILDSMVAARGDVVSATLRRSDDRIVAKATAAPPRHVDAAKMQASTVRVPILRNNENWGSLDVAFAAPAIPWYSLEHPITRLIVFSAAMSFAAVFVYLERALPELALKQLRILPRRVRDTLNLLVEGVLILDGKHRISLANRAFSDLVGQSPEKMVGVAVSSLNWEQMQVDRRGDSGEYPWSVAAKSHATHTSSIITLRPSRGGDKRMLAVNSAPLLTDNGSQLGVLATFHDVTKVERKNTTLRKLLNKLRESRVEIRRQNHQLKILATHDSLTSCLNRRALFDQFEREWAAAERHGQSLSCIMVDIDHFKSINDNHGHQAGDEVLKLVANTLKNHVRREDFVGRYGGEEFCVLLPKIDGPAAAEAADRFRQEIAKLHPSGIAVTASFGVAHRLPGTTSIAELVSRADQCLYASKESGRNRVTLWDAEHGAAVPAGHHAS